MTQNIIFLIGVSMLASISIAQPVSAQSNSETDPQVLSNTENTEMLARGAKSWANQCSRCHNLRSPGELSPDLWDVSVMHMRVRANIPGDVADDIKAFLMSSSLPGANSRSAGSTRPTGDFSHLKPGDKTNGFEVYAQTCVACHGDNGKGALEGIPDFTASNSRLKQSSDTLMTNMINGFQSEGSLMEMPAMGGNPDLTEQDMADVLAYLTAEFLSEYK